jgi:hypothetical protein
MGPKSKKEKKETEEERAIREEAEHKAAELAAKKHAEEVEKARIAAETLNNERIAYRKEELLRLEAEKAIISERNEEKNKRRIYEDLTETSRLDWEKYKDPSDEFDPTSERDLNTFISLTSDINVNDLKDCIGVVKNIEQVITNVECVWSDSVANKNLALQTLSKNYLIKFSTMILEKLDLATVKILRFVDNHVNDRHEINIEEIANKSGIGLWTCTSEIRPIRKSVHFEKLGVQIDIPKQILQQDARFVHRVIRMPTDIYTLNSYENDSLKSNTKFVLGDIILIDIVYPLANAHILRAKKWTIRDASETNQTIRRSAYPSSVACRCFIKVPDNVIMSDDVRIGIWNEEKKEWSEDGITEYQYSETTRNVQFYMTVTGIVALIKDRNIELPYKQWSLKTVREISVRDTDAFNSTFVNPLYEKQARLAVSTQRREVVIDINGSLCKLVKPVLKQLSHLIGVEMSPGNLLFNLQKCGINLFPTDLDPNLIENNIVKNVDLENQVFEQIAQCVSAMDFSSSAWNQTLSPSQIGIMARESTEYVGSLETYDYESVLVEDDVVSESYKNAPNEGVLSNPKYTLVLGNQYGVLKNFSHNVRPNEVTHLELIKAMESRLTTETKERIARSNERFQKNVYTILRLIKPFSLA